VGVLACLFCLITAAAFSLSQSFYASTTHISSF
jgi:hypothetical protein